MTSDKSGYVYVIRETRTGLYKIGITRNLERRMQQLGVNRTATLISHMHRRDPERVERELHRRHAANRIPQTEYFHLSTPPLLPVEAPRKEPRPRRPYAGYVAPINPRLLDKWERDHWSLENLTERVEQRRRRYRNAKSDPTGCLGVLAVLVLVPIIAFSPPLIKVLIVLLAAATVLASYLGRR